MRRCFLGRKNANVPAIVCNLIAVGLLVGTPGCTGDSTPKESHFEVDHEVAAHWPDGLADLCAKLRGYLGADAAELTPQQRTEIEDLVGWVGEVAADTNMREADWDPLYRKSQSILTDLRARPGALTTATREDIRSLCSAIEETLPRIPSVSTY